MSKDSQYPKSPTGLEMIGDSENFVWVVIEAYSLESQKTYARDDKSITRGTKMISSYKFLLPEEWQENISHEWGETESMAGRLAQSIMKKQGIKEDIGGVIQSAKATIKSGQNKQSIQQMLTAAGKGLSRDTIAHKIDNSYVYKGSPRRTYTFVFELVVERDPKKDVFDPIKSLEALSCPIMDGDFVGIKFPSIFKVYTKPNSLIYIENAALTGVQPTFQGPYINGYPSACTVSLTFTDLNPMYRSTVNGEITGKISVSTKE
jgi:hypothetical protein